MKNTYSTPESEVIGIRLEENILSGPKSTGSSSGRNMDSPDYSQNPF
ncbi:MAG: hypothetical protein K6A64_03700 [Bacteroidales bacterium]|nr:hypothetical protein [Bacteroidales bacterium]